MEGIRLLAERGVHVQAKLPILRNNARDVAEITRLCAELGVEVASSTTITMRDDGDWAPLTFRLPDAALAEHLQVHPEVAQAREVTPEDHVCATGKNTLVVTPYGDVYPCVQLKVSAGNVRRQSLAEIWNNSPFLKEIRDIRLKDFEECMECEHVSYCRVCMGLSWYEHGQLTVPNSFDCRRSDITARLNLISGVPSRPQHIGEPVPPRSRILGLPPQPARVGEVAAFEQAQKQLARERAQGSSGKLVPGGQLAQALADQA